MGSVIPTSIVASSRLANLSPRRVARELERLMAVGARIDCAGAARARPEELFELGYVPKYKVELFDTVFYLTRLRQNIDIRFFVAYVVQPGRTPTKTTLYPRIFYKDVSLVWRSASHFVQSENENWIGKGEVRSYVSHGEEFMVSAEETTDLPLEIQTALDEASRAARRVTDDTRAVALVLRRGPDDRIEPYRDFTAPRERARSEPRNLVNGGRPIARFMRKVDPSSLRFTRGFEPDFDAGSLERSDSRSKLYGGRVRRFRILSRNRRIHYMFFAGPRHVWIIPPQALTTELSTFGVRTVDVFAPDDLFVPGYEFHYMEDGEDGAELVTQIPAGFAGEPSALDDARADASAWLDALPVVQEFRKKVLGSR